jgi:DNA mismatch repair protein MutL
MTNDSALKAQDSQLKTYDSQLHPAIQVLAPEVVERIAAGEVVERPVSVVRELLDNALDAGAADIRIDIRGGGLRSIRVTDDGSGIPAGEVELAVRHHATSKIRAAEDLAGVASLGFRGEALASIAAVSELTLQTATAGTPGGVDGARRVGAGVPGVGAGAPGVGTGAPVGVRIDVRHGVQVSRELIARPPGTMVTVRNLFASVPARLKFIGNARVESAHISQLVRRYALAHPHTRFTLTLDGHPSLRTSGLGLEGTVREVFGLTVAAALLSLGPLEIDSVILSGLVSGPQLTRSSRTHITLLVNGRCVGSRLLLAAFEEAYRPLLPRGRHPLAILMLHVPRARVDVNVHPSKAEIKIEGEAGVAGALRDAVRETLGRKLATPPGDRSFALGFEQLPIPRMVAERGPEWESATGDRLRAAHVVGQVHNALILLSDESGLYLVDQHRAHERAIYELLRRRHAEGRADRHAGAIPQLLLEPLHIELSPEQIDRLQPRLPELAALGFVCEWFGGRSFLVRSLPMIPETGDLRGFVEDLLDSITPAGSPASAPGRTADDETDWQHRLLTAIACRSATRRGRPLSPAQGRELVDLLAGTESPAVCPHGSPIILHFSDRFLERQFDW